MRTPSDAVGASGLWSLKDLAELWHCSPATVKAREKAGFIKRAIGVPGVYYTAASVARCNGMEADEDPMSPFERRQLESRIRELERRVEQYEAQFYILQEAIARAMKMLHGRQNRGTSNGNKKI